MSVIVRVLGQIWDHAFGHVSRDHILSLVDQVVVSGSSFLTTLLIARSSGAGQLGVYAVGMSLLLSSVAFQDSLILQPYTILRHRSQGTPAEHWGASLILSVLFSVGSILVLTLIAMSFLEWDAGSEIVAMTWAVAGIIPFALTREFARRVAFARLEVGRAFLLDSTVAVVQLSILGWLAASGRMSAPSACAALGGASVIAVAGWLYFTRAEFTVRMRHLRVIFKQTWALGKWLLVGRITVQIQGYITYWIAMVIAGSAVTGVYAASMSVVNFVNPLIFALGNVFTAKMVLAWKNGGGPQLWHEAIRNTVLIGALLAAFCLAVLVGGDYVMRFLYHGKEYEGLGHTLTVLALGVFATTVGFPASFGLATMGRPRAIVVVGIITAALTVVLIWLLMLKWGLLGAAYGLLAGNVAGTVGRWIAFSLFIPTECDITLVTRVLHNFAKVADQSGWIIARIGGGEQAEVYRIESDGSFPIDGAHHTVVVKLYKPEAAVTFEMVQAQFNSLANLHAALDSREINGWTISVPHPLHICKSPLAFVMTTVSGQYFDRCASEDGVPTSDALQDAAHPFAIAMAQYWSSGRRHADLGLRNVLFDIEAKKISLIDPGTSDSCRTCSDIVKFPSAAASDLAHILCDVETDVMDLVGSPARMSREIFVESVLRLIIENIGSEKEKRQLLNDIRASFQEHLAECLEPSWSLKGVSHFVVKKIALNRAHSMLERVISPNCSSTKSNHEFQRAIRLK